MFPIENQEAIDDLYIAPILSRYNRGMKCEIFWNQLSLEQWEEYFQKIPKSNLLQHYGYARAVCQIDRQRARWGLIKIDGHPAGLVQILEAGFLWNAVHAVLLDRGPLWFDGFGGAAHLAAFFQKFNDEFPKRFGRKRRILPEVENGLAVQKMLTQTGLEIVNKTLPYETLWWDLTIDEETARQNLKKNWRGALQKAEKAGLEILWDDKGAFYPALRQIYMIDKKIKKYDGASPELLDNLAKFSTSTSPMVIGKVRMNGHDIAYCMFICHGTSATYQVGWSSQDGREYCAHHFLLWQARFMLQSKNIDYLDLGGVNDKTAKGIKKFKEGTGATSLCLSGHYR